jgi:hypothetical protein
MSGEIRGRHEKQEEAESRDGQPHGARACYAAEGAVG